jgi:dienelactone hydrolase
LSEQPGIDKHRIGLVGTSLGANVALRYAAFNADLGALLLLSPGMIYRGLRADESIRKIGSLPLRFVVSRNDAFYFESCKRLVTIRHEKDQAPVDAKELTICTGNLHGTEMLKGVGGLAPQLIDWLKETLRVSAPSPDVPAK